VRSGDIGKNVCSAGVAVAGEISSLMHPERDVKKKFGVRNR
jgi:hypothetical protein